MAVKLERRSMLKHFSEDEFNHFDKMDKRFLEFLDDVRSLAGVAFVITSDYRTREDNQRVGGSATSAHLKGRAVDFVIRPWNGATYYGVIAAAVAVSSMPKWASHGMELKVAPTPNRHIHIAWDGWPQSSFIVG